MSASQKAKAEDAQIRAKLAKAGWRVDRVIPVTMTGYSSETPGMSDKGTCETKLGKGSVSVDPKVIKLWSHLYVSGGYGYGQALDTGLAIQGAKIDLWFKTEEEAIQFGRRSGNVYLISRVSRKRSNHH
ncbi:MAG: 3D domain-containing protein [bacterium]|nr:3D domain-containing protein [bacterium]